MDACCSDGVLPLPGSCFKAAGEGPGVDNDCPNVPRWYCESGAECCPNLGAGTFVMGCGAGVELNGGAGDATLVVAADGRLSRFTGAFVSSWSEFKRDIRFDFLGGSGAGVGADDGVCTGIGG